MFAGWLDTFFTEKTRYEAYNAYTMILSEGVYLLPNRGFDPKDEKERIKQFIISKAGEMGVDYKLALALSQCESNFNSSAVGDKGRSFGLWQIHLPAHPKISKEQALDINWSTNWALNKIKEGKAGIWSCLKLI